MTQTSSSPTYKRILLKISGEALMGDQEFGVHPEIVSRTTAEIISLVEAGVEVGLVIGGGNLFRGVSLAAGGMQRATADQVGMLATVMNALIVADQLNEAGVDTRVMSAFPMGGICEHFDRQQAVRHLKKGRVVIFSAGTGNPYFTTDTAATLRGIEIGAELVLKATKVDGVYSADPVKDPAATRYEHLSYDVVIEKQLGVMDLTAMMLCRDHNMPIRVFNMNQENALMGIICGEDHGTLVDSGSNISS